MHQSSLQLIVLGVSLCTIFPGHLCVRDDFYSFRFHYGVGTSFQCLITIVVYTSLFLKKLCNSRLSSQTVSSSLHYEFLTIFQFFYIVDNKGKRQRETSHQRNNLVYINRESWTIDIRST